MNRISLSVANIGVQIAHAPRGKPIQLHPNWAHFWADDQSKPDIYLHVTPSLPDPSLDNLTKKFTAQPDGLWTIYENEINATYLIILHDRIGAAKPYLSVIANRWFSRLTLRLAPEWPHPVLYPFEYPLDELAVSSYLNLNKLGILIHAAAIVIDGKGYLFPGSSGAGKSTLAQIFQQESKHEVLTDERAVVRYHNNQIWVYGTPWHGTAKMHVNKGVPLGGFFFLGHGATTMVTALSAIQGTNKLIVRSFPTFWHRQGLEFAMDFCADLAHTYPCYDLAFLPDAHLVPSIEAAIQSWQRHRQY